MKTAVIFGATGAIGHALMLQLAADPDYQRVVVFSRRKSGLEASPTIEEHIVSNIVPDASYTDLTAADVFCCLGTTIKVAGSQQAFRAVDYGLVCQLLAWGEKAQVASFHVISSIGADAESSSFYLRTKGEMEAKVRQAKIPSKCIYRPSLLFGASRESFRAGEGLSLFILYPLRWLPFSRCQRLAPIKVEQVATAMRVQSKKNLAGNHLIQSDQMAAMTRNR